MLKNILFYNFILFFVAAPATAQPVYAPQPQSEDNYVPEGTVTIPGSGSTGVIAPIVRNPSEFTQYPDLPLPQGNIQEPVSVKFAFDHRSALSAKVISVRGYVVHALLGEDACPSKPASKEDWKHPRPLRACTQPRITLSDSNDPNRNTEQNLTVLLKETDKTAYIIGKMITVKGAISGNGNYIIMHEDEEAPLPLEK